MNTHNLKLAVLSLLISLVSFSSNRRSDVMFPDKETILVEDYANYDNFFPIATLDLSNKGIKDKIHIVYVSFDPSIDHYKPFSPNDNIDEFTFSITDNGLYKPTFEKSALVIGKDFEEHLKIAQETYTEAKSKDSTSPKVRKMKYLSWWQGDQTPVNSLGNKMKFICQIDILSIANDDCRLFVFYDEHDQVVKHIYQRT